MTDASPIPARTHHRRAIIWGLLVVLVACTLWFGPPIVCMVVTDAVYVRERKFHFPDGRVAPARVGWQVTAERWGLNFCFRDPQEEWYTSTGLLSKRYEPWSDRVTHWDPDGKIYVQCFGVSFFDRHDSPPWLWGMTDQTEPTAPWIIEGISFEEWWASIPDGLKRENGF